ncbi:M23 family metallopeptidase [Kamptonema formosum]|uniref:M23 family metallopeptidase n=1 Tax=Kamptonema formosum TaxID=331992 RepID=UPI0005C6445C|nr:M23 family metallopeptidase [Oscillatoria sp. PCC 10802]
MKLNRFGRLERLLLLAGASLIALVALGYHPSAVKAQGSESAQTATGSWLAASFPVENFQEYSSPYGPRGYGEFHYGLDIAAPQGSYIRNWWSGEVVEVIDDDRCGTGLVIQSGKWEHVYCHMEGQVGQANGRNYLIDREGGILVWHGQQLSAGVRIGRVGMSGRTSGPHLHWGLRYAENWIDPGTVLRAMYGEQTAALSRRLDTQQN